jgi:hypothetical protein
MANPLFRKFKVSLYAMISARMQAKNREGDNPTKIIFSNLSCGCTPGGGFSHAFVSRNRGVAYLLIRGYEIYAEAKIESPC